MLQRIYFVKSWLPIDLLNLSCDNYGTNYPLIQATVMKIYKLLVSSLVLFFSILNSHMSNEFEVQIRDGVITEEGQAALHKLNQEYHQFQYKINIHNILDPWVAVLLDQPLTEHTLEVINNIVPRIIYLVEMKIVEAQTIILAERGVTTNRLCASKCSTGPRVHNLTTLVIPPDIMTLLGTGLDVVPQTKQDAQSIKATILSNLKSAAIAYFRSTIGHYPYGTDSISELDPLLLHLSMLTPCGSPLSEFYFKLRDTYKISIDVFLGGIVSDVENKTPSALIKQNIPDNFVITPTDKNLGVALVPIGWYHDQYKSHVIKGGYILSHLNESQCIYLLVNKIQQLWDENCVQQNTLLRRAWPKYYSKKYKIGVLKIIPKIHKLKEITPESWLKLPSRPIRGAEMCPLNAPSKV